MVHSDSPSPQRNGEVGVSEITDLVAAAGSWQFDPAVRCEYPNLQAQQAQDCSGGRETPQAVSLAYRFVFEQRERRGSVRIGH